MESKINLGVSNQVYWSPWTPGCQIRRSRT